MIELLKSPYFILAATSLLLFYLEIRSITLKGREFFHHSTCLLYNYLCRQNGNHVILIPQRLQSMIMGGGLTEGSLLYVEEAIPMVADPGRIVISSKEASETIGTVFKIQKIGKRNCTLEKSPKNEGEIPYSGS
jgi:hypothetical protein